MNTPSDRPLLFAALAALLLASGTSAFAQDKHAENHQHGDDVPEMDADGKRLESYQVKHKMDQATLDALRAKIALYRGMSDMQIHLNMSAMGPNYEWYASDPEMRGDIGVLILSHGVGENSDRMMKEALTPVSERWPTAIGFGMAMMQSDHLQAAVDDLQARGAKTIVLVPNGTTTGYDSLTRQWRYIFDIGDQEATYLEVPKVQSDARFVMSGHFGDNPLITEILYEHVKEVSKNPANEVVIIVGHGPEDSADNGPDLEILQVHVDRIAAKNEFADVKIINLQDDAIPAIRETNVRKLRRWVKQANQKGQTPIVVAIAAASHGVQTHIRTDLRGLDYVFAERGLSEDPKYVDWVTSVIETAIAEEQLARSE
jgi:vacuolar-type H+-ATPase subunit F/Vma7